ncbi:protein-tyrosine phosphatase-like protein [Aspergillus egyptiacus]|nr:protein-tyrosine phosphatase-like protein [Aspergillus egyptiacus]
MTLPYNLHQLVTTDIQSPLPPAAVADIISNPPFVTVPGLFNLRDISPASSSSFSSSNATLRPRLAYRCGALPTTLPPGATTALAALGIEKIFDLRRPDERTKKPSPVIDGIETVWIPDANAGKPPGFVSAPPAEAERSIENLVDMYTGYLSSHAPVFRSVFEHVRDNPGVPFLFHCSAGKDRTGVLAALLHRLAGSADEAIVHDFTLSRVGIEPGRAALLSMMQSAYGESAWENPVLLVLWGVHAAGMSGFLTVLDELHGGVEGYLRTLGFGEEDLERMRVNLRVGGAVDGIESVL